jgi:hypothetical protein
MELAAESPQSISILIWFEFGAGGGAAAGRWLWKHRSSAMAKREARTTLRALWGVSPT